MRVISGHTIPTGSALVFRVFRNEAIGTVAPLTTVERPFIPKSTAAPGLPVLRTTASALGTRLASGGAIRAASAFTATTSFTAPTTTLPIATATATLAMPAPATAEAGGKHLTSALGTSKRVHYTGRAEHRGDGSQFHLLADRVQYLQASTRAPRSHFVTSRARPRSWSSYSSSTLTSWVPWSPWCLETNTLWRSTVTTTPSLKRSTSSRRRTRRWRFWLNSCKT